MNAGDALAARVRQCVASLVPPEQVEVTCRAVGQALNILVTEPAFTNELRVVQMLAQENQWLKSQVIQLQRILAVGQMTVAVKTPRKRAPAKKAPAAKMGGNASRGSKAAFKQGARQARK